VAGKVWSERWWAVAQEGGSPPFAPIGRAGFEPFDPAARARTGKAAHHRREQLALVLLEGQGVIATSLEHDFGKRAMAMQRIGRNDTVLETQQSQHFHCAERLVA